VLFESWIHLVRQPHLEIFGEYQDCFGWITLVVLAQGIVWGLAGWPSTRLLVLTGVLFSSCFSGLGRYFRIPIRIADTFLAGCRAGPYQPAKNAAWSMAGMDLETAAAGHVRSRGIAWTEAIFSPAQAQFVV